MEKLLEVQKELGAVYKDQDNPFFKSKYADINAYIDAIKPVLSKHGLVLLQPLTNLDGKPAIETVILAGNRQVFTATIPLPEITDPQKMGAAITYFRRYALQSLFVMKAMDDDGNSIKIETAPKSTYKGSSTLPDEPPF